jgi:hypothetical protein
MTSKGKRERANNRALLHLDAQEYGLVEYYRQLFTEIMVREN